MAESLIPPEAPQLPTSTSLRQAKMVLQQLKAFCDVQPTYQHDGWQHLDDVIGLVDWVSNNQHVARRVE